MRVLTRALKRSLLLTAAFASGLAVLTAAPTPIKIGVPLDLSGVMADYGLSQRKAFELFASEVNAKGGFQGHPLELMVTDTLANPTNVTTLSEKFIENGALLLMGGTNSTENLAMKTVAARRKVLNLATAGSIATLSSPVDPWTFQMNGRDDVRLDDLIRIAVEQKKFKKIAMINMNNAWGNAGREAMVKILKDKYGLQPIALEATEAGPVSLVPQMLRIKNSGAEAVISWVYITDNPVALRAMIEVNFKPLVLSNLACTRSMIDRTGPVPLQHISHSAWSWDRPDAMDVAARLGKYVGRDMKYEDTWAVPWNTMQVLMEGLRKANLSFDPKDIASDRQKLRDAVESIKDLPIIGGKVGATISFSPEEHQGYRKEAFVNKETSNGTDWQMYKE